MRAPRVAAPTTPSAVSPTARWQLAQHFRNAQLAADAELAAKASEYGVEVQS